MTQVNPLQTENDWRIAAEAIRELVRTLNGQLIMPRDAMHFDHILKIVRKGESLGFLQITEDNTEAIVITEKEKPHLDKLTNTH